jgi:hypothetical protein
VRRGVQSSEDIEADSTYFIETVFSQISLLKRRFCKMNLLRNWDAFLPQDRLGSKIRYGAAYYLSVGISVHEFAGVGHQLKVKPPYSVLVFAALTSDTSFQFCK